MGDEGGEDSGPSSCFYFDDLTDADAADVLGVSIGTVKSQTHTALRRLRQELAWEPVNAFEEKP